MLLNALCSDCGRVLWPLVEAGTGERASDALRAAACDKPACTAQFGELLAHLKGCGAFQPALPADTELHAACAAGPRWDALFAALPSSWRGGRAALINSPSARAAPRHCRCAAPAAATAARRCARTFEIDTSADACAPCVCAPSAQARARPARRRATRAGGRRRRLTLRRRRRRSPRPRCTSATRAAVRCRSGCSRRSSAHAPSRAPRPPTPTLRSRPSTRRALGAPRRTCVGESRRSLSISTMRTRRRRRGAGLGLEMRRPRRRRRRRRPRACRRARAARSRPRRRRARPGARPRANSSDTRAEASRPGCGWACGARCSARARCAARRSARSSRSRPSSRTRSRPTTASRARRSR